MGRYKIYLLNIQILIMTISCVSTSEPVEIPTNKVQEETIPEAKNNPVNEVIIGEIMLSPGEVVVITEDFNPASISYDYYLSVREDVKRFIDELNDIIKKQDYNTWKEFLSPEYFEEISSTEHLHDISELPAMKTRNITLKTLQDYFTHVFIPSRENSRVDDIEFVGLYRVKAFTIQTNKAGDEQRLLLYNLEKNGDMWKIIN